MEEPVSQRQRWLLALLATSTLTISYVDRQTLAVLAPTVTRALSISDANYGWLISAFSMAYLLGAQIGGWVIDRVGARRGLVGAFLIWTAIAGLHAVAPGFAVLFGLRIALGLAESPSFPGAAQTVYRSLEGPDRARGLGFLFTGSSVGAMIALPLASYLEVHFGWRVAFLTTALAGMVWLPVWVWATFRARPRAMLDRPPTPNAQSTSIAVVLRHPAVLRGLALILASAPAISFTLLWGAKFFAREYHLDQLSLGKMLWIPALVFDLGAVGFGDLAARYRARHSDGRPPRVVIAAAAALCTLIALLPLLENPWVAVGVCAVSMAGGGGLYTVLTGDMLARIPARGVAVAGGICAATQSLAYVIANPIVGRVVQATGSYHAVLVALGLWVIPGAAISVVGRAPSAGRVVKRRRLRPRVGPTRAHEPKHLFPAILCSEQHLDHLANGSLASCGPGDQGGTQPSPQARRPRDTRRARQPRWAEVIGLIAHVAELARVEPGDPAGLLEASPLVFLTLQDELQAELPGPGLHGVAAPGGEDA